MSSKNSVRIVEVGPRDGLQNEKKNLSVEERKELIRRLTDSGLKRIEIGAFVSAEWVPQMAGSVELSKDIIQLQDIGELPKEAIYSCLVPNVRGMEDALKSGVKEIGIFGACTEAFSKKNINCSVAQSFVRFREVIEIATRHKIKVRGYLSVAFGCPYEGKVSEARVIRLIKSLFKLGVYEVSIGDTIGVATPKQVESLLKGVGKIAPLSKIAMHMHDTRATALANVYASYKMGVRTFDSSIGGLGGCPYAKGASGNLATEDLVYLLSGLGLKTNVDLGKLIDTRKWLEGIIGRELPSKVSQVGFPSKATW